MLARTRLGKALVLGGVMVGLAGCDDLLTVQDPSRFTDEDLDQALGAVANGVEGGLHAQMDNHNNLDAIISDLFKHTGTWSGWDDIDHGLIRYDNDGSSDGGAGLLRARFAAQDALRRFDRLEGDGQNVDPALRAQVAVTEGWIDLLLGQHYCESVGDPTVDADGAITAQGQVQTDVEMWQQAVTKLRAAMTIAPGSDFALWAEAGVARGELFLGNYGAANTAASNVLGNAPAGWEKLALFQISTLENSIVNLSTIGFNNASGLREKWWPLVDDAAEAMNNPFGVMYMGINEPDPRIGVRHVPGVLGVDGTTDFHSQWKYQDVGADIPFTDTEEMILIQAEAELFGNNDLVAARTLLNGLRTAAGLTPVPDAMADDVAELTELLLWERFAELYMEGQREIDLLRFNLIPGLMAAGDFVETIPDRAVKFPLSGGEGLNNPNVEDDAAVRCTPTRMSS